MISVRLLSLQGRLLLTYLALTLIGLGGLILWTGQRLQEATLEQAQRDLELQASLIANALREPLEGLHEGEGHGGRPMEVLIRSYAIRSGARVTLVDAGFRVLLSSDARVPPGVQQAAPELVAAREGRGLRRIRREAWDLEERLYVASPVTGEEGRIMGYVQLSIPTASLSAQIRQTWTGLLLTGGVMLGITVLVSLWLARQISRPLKTLTKTSEEIASGSLEGRVDPEGPEEFRRLAVAFNRMADRIQEMLARQRAFAMHAAHELRTPLTSLRLRLEMLQTHARGDAELTARYLGQMERDVDHLQRLVQNLLALSALDEGEHPPRALLDLSPLLYALADEIGPVAHQAGLDLHVDVPAHLPPVEANEDQVRTVIRNLLDNAIQYTPAGGRITLRAWAHENGEVHIAVADTGVGIPEEALPLIFERFYRVDKVTARRHGGAGLGLALVREIVQAQGGRVEVRSRPGEGSTFTVRLPIAKHP